MAKKTVWLMLKRDEKMPRINKTLAIDVRADFVTRMRSIGKTPKEIAKLDRFLFDSLQNVNDLAAVAWTRTD
ncbi:hypothetical protein [Paraglaciecola sp. 25GB23A]|uniref:hypothetical protein n=1 Tax=Paraglaciecola sp. 25GB23A TaxID=3156068 RepID=UPI0032B01C1D